MSKKRSDTFRFYVGLLVVVIVIVLGCLLIDFYWDHADYLFDVLGVNTMSPWPWIVIGVICIWLSRLEWRQYLKWQEKSPSPLNRLRSNGAALTLGVGLAALLIGIVILVYR